jgi:ATP-dependent RNA helicase HelY
MGRRSFHRFQPNRFRFQGCWRVVMFANGCESSLRGWASPEPQPFTPSDFQIAALNAVLERDTIVVAPTGSGKTWIAEQAIAHFLAEGRRSWYTTPFESLEQPKI